MKERALSLRDLRQLRHLKQSEVAQDMHVTQSWVSGMEGRRLESMTINTLARYVGALGGQLRVVVDLPGSTHVLVFGPKGGPATWGESSPPPHRPFGQ